MNEWSMIFYERNSIAKNMQLDSCKEVNGTYLLSRWTVVHRIAAEAHRAFKSPGIAHVKSSRYQSRANVTISRGRNGIALGRKIRQTDGVKGKRAQYSSRTGKVTRNRIYWRRRESAGEFLKSTGTSLPLPFDSPVNHNSSRGRWRMEQCARGYRRV